MPNAVTASNNVDHTQSVAHKDEFKTGIDPTMAETINAFAYFSNSLEEIDFESLDLDETVPDEMKDEYTEMFTSDLGNLLEKYDIGEEWDVDVELDDLEDQAVDCNLEQEHVKTVIELDSKINSLSQASSAEAPAVKGHIACSAVAVCVAAVVAAAVGAVVAAGVAATVAAAVNTTVVTGHY